MVDDEKALRDVEGQIAALEAEKEAILIHGLPDDESLDRRDYSSSFGGGGRGDDGWER